MNATGAAYPPVDGDIVADLRGARMAAEQTAAIAVEALRRERQRGANVRLYLTTVPDDTPLDVVRREVSAVYGGEPEPGRE